MNLELLTKQVANISRATGSYIKNELKRVGKEDIESKGTNDFVTYVDKTSEERLVQELSKILPEAGFIAEEGTGYHTADRFNWVIDPLDGTTNFIHGAQPFSISIGLIDGHEIISGVVYEIVQNECFYAWQNGGTYLNGHKIKVSSIDNISNCLVATGFPYSDFNRLDEYLKVFIHLMKNSHGVRRLGSAAVDLAYVACGRYDAFFEYGLHPWDVCAGAILVMEAGGFVADFKGENSFIYGQEIIAGNQGIYNEFINVIRDGFGN